MVHIRTDGWSFGWIPMTEDNNIIYAIAESFLREADELKAEYDALAIQRDSLAQRMLDLRDKVRAFADEHHLPGGRA